MYIHLSGRRYYVNLFHPLAFVSEQCLPSLFVHIFFWAVSRDMVAASSTSPGCLYCLELHLNSLFLVYQQEFFLLAGLLRKI